MPRKYFFVNYWAFLEIAKTILADFITKINKKLLLIEFVQFANNGVNFMLFGNPSKLHVIGHFLAIIIFWGSLNLYQYHQNSDFFWWGETRSIKKHHFLMAKQNLQNYKGKRMLLGSDSISVLKEIWTLL